RGEGRLLGLALAEQVWGLALADRAPGDAAAEAHFAAGLAEMEAVEQVLPAALARLEWARRCRRAGDEARARALGAQAGAHPAASRCADVLERACWPSAG